MERSGSRPPHMAGRYQEEWVLAKDGVEQETAEKGYVGGVKLQF